MYFKSKRYLIFFSILLIIIMTETCDKTPVGYDELEREMSEPIFNEFRATSRFSYGKYSNLGSADYLVIGRNSEYESRILMKFSLDDTTVNAESVVSMKLVFYPKRHNNINFKIHPIQESAEWTETGATWKKTDGFVPWDVDGGDYYPTVLAQTSLSEDSCVIPLPMSKLDTIINHSFGIIFIPDIATDSFATIYSRSTSHPPRLVFKLMDSSTVAYNPNLDCHIIDTLDLIFPPTELWVGTGFPYRTMLKFNIDTIPANVTIAYAELTVNITNLYSMSDTQSIGLWQIMDSSFSSSSDLADNISNQTRYLILTDSVVTFDIRRLVQLWNTKPDSNFGLLISGYPESYEIFRAKVRTGVMQPVLKIGYILPPKGRF